MHTADQQHSQTGETCLWFGPACWCSICSYQYGILWHAIQAGLLQIVPKNLVAINLLSRMLEAGDSTRVEALRVSWDFSQHPCFPVVGIKSSR